jgi:hypothetical protein
VSGELRRLTRTGIAPALTSCWRLSSMSCQECTLPRGMTGYSPECVMFSKAPVALRCTLMSLDLANLVNGTSAPDFAILVLLSSASESTQKLIISGEYEYHFHELHAPCVARLVTQPTALHCTSTFGLSIWRIKGSKPPSFTMSSLLSATSAKSTYKKGTWITRK